MSTHHTPGPWTINGGAIEGPPQTVPGCERPLASIVAHVYDEDENGPPESDANARLIAMAPELLDAAQHLVQTLCSMREAGYFRHGRDVSAYGDGAGLSSDWVGLEIAIRNAVGTPEHHATFIALDDDEQQTAAWQRANPQPPLDPTSVPF